ncbi:MAG: hypothetical protein AAGF20_12415 [Pseudomonadota bacterium]
MYWRAENADAWCAMWEDVQAAGRAHGLDLPELTAPDDIPQPWTDHWLRDDLILSQTCSMPLRTTLRDQVSYVGTFDFGLNAPQGMYYSRFLKTDRNAKPKTLAINGYDSQSGFVAGCEPLMGAFPQTAYAQTLEERLVTGSHAASLRAVAEGRADACYLDAVTYRLCKAYDPWAKAPYLAGKTRPTPGLPLITSKAQDPAPLRAALQDLFSAKPTWIGSAALGGLQDFVVLDDARYLDLPVP